VGGVTVKWRRSGPLRIVTKHSVTRFGKAEYPEPAAQDVMSRLARAYGVRRDGFDVRDAVRDRAGLGRSASWAVDAVIGAIINAYRRDPEAVDRLATGGGIPDWARERAVKSSRTVVPNPEEVVDSVLAEIARALQAAEPDKPHG